MLVVACHWYLIKRLSPLDGSTSQQPERMNQYLKSPCLQLPATEPTLHSRNLLNTMSSLLTTLNTQFEQFCPMQLEHLIINLFLYDRMIMIVIVQFF